MNTARPGGIFDWPNSLPMNFLPISAAKTALEWIHLRGERTDVNLKSPSVRVRYSLRHLKSRADRNEERRSGILHSFLI